MGKIIRVNPNLIQPSQNFLKEDTIRFIIDCLRRGDKGSLPPTPIVRLNPENETYIAIDGHNLLAVNALLGKECEIYVAFSANDPLTLEISSKASIEALQQRNDDLKEKFAKVVVDLKTIQAEGIHSFRDLLCKYPHLVELTSNLHK